MRFISNLRSFAFMLAILATPSLPSAANAATMRIVALGASNTAGKGVSVAWPELLQRMLRARGYDAQVTNAGVSGNDVDQMLARLDSAAPDGTQLVILDKGGNNAAHGVSIHPAVAQIQARLKARGIKLIVIPSMHAWANYQLQPGGLEITEKGHAIVAARLLPLVIAALGSGRH
ncbi:MAG TPA: GDSL-type esterase/lipase family protein [Xanthobacteraceae bacterium]|nr:GDSL-type esterase/lipase family protein [Xanthobacteraceae bacterium]